MVTRTMGTDETRDAAHSWRVCASVRFDDRSSSGKTPHGAGYNRSFPSTARVQIDPYSRSINPQLSTAPIWYSPYPGDGEWT